MCPSAADGDVVVRAVAPQEWRALRAVRLRALEADPRLRRNARARRRGAARAVGGLDRRHAGAGGRVVRRGRGRRVFGMAAATAPPDDPALARLNAIWVDPIARGHGLGERLVAAVVDWARARDARTLMLSVAEGNAAAQALDHRLDFRPTGARGTLGDGRRGLATIALERAL